MDFSRKYIDMCREAKEIQDKRLAVGDDFGYVAYEACLEHNKVCDVDEERDLRCDECGKSRKHSYPVNTCWLPRQDDLQEIMNMDLGDMMKALLDFKNSICELEGSGFDTLEQYWLAFVMKNKFGKIFHYHFFLALKLASLV